MLEFFFIELLFNSCYIFNINLIYSVKFSHSVVSNSLWPHELQHARIPCPSPTPRTCSNACPSSQWCHPIISFSYIPFFSCCLQSFPTLESFPVSHFFASGGQSIGAPALALPMNIQGWFPLGWTALISLLSKGLSGVFVSTVVGSINYSVLNPLYGPTLTSIHD